MNPNNTWTWDGVDWTMQSPVTQPPLVYYIPAAYDVALGEVVMFGGLSSTEATWSWKGDDWVLLDSHNPPPPLNSQGLAYDKKTDQLIMFGGVDGNILGNDTYRLIKK